MVSGPQDFSGKFQQLLSRNMTFLNFEKQWLANNHFSMKRLSSFYFEGKKKTKAINFQRLIYAYKMITFSNIFPSSFHFSLILPLLPSSCIFQYEGLNLGPQTFWANALSLSYIPIPFLCCILRQGFVKSPRQISNLGSSYVSLPNRLVS